MVRPARELIGSPYPVEVDETWIGGATQGEGKGVHHKTLVVGAMEVRPGSAIPFGGENPNLIGGQVPSTEAKGAARKGIRRKAGPRSMKGGHGRNIVAGRLRLRMVPNRSADVLSGFRRPSRSSGVPGADGRLGGLRAVGFSGLSARSRPCSRRPGTD